MFVDNDDMCHPLRFFYFLSNAQKSHILPLSIPCKLLLDENLTPSQGRIENFVKPDDPFEFNLWKKKRFLARNVTVVSNSKAVEMDAEEYFDFIVPSCLLEKFFRLTPLQVSSHKFSDLRLWAVLEHMCPLRTDGLPEDAWLLAHYKISEDSKRATFDNKGKRVESVQSVDMISMSDNKAGAADVSLSERFPPLTPEQVSMCRAHIESVVIQSVGWNEQELEHCRVVKVKELNRSHGTGFGDQLWDECLEQILSLFDTATLEASKDAWKHPVVE